MEQINTDNKIGSKKQIDYEQKAKLENIKKRIE